MIIGFIGAPLASAISMNLVSLASIIYGVFFIPSTAWHPICRRRVPSRFVYSKKSKAEAMLIAV